MPQTLINIFVFIFGQPTQMFWTAFMMILVVGAVDLFKSRPFKETCKEILEKAFAYAALVVIANRIDSFAINALFGWQGSSQFVACIYIFARETKQVTAYLATRFGISIPFLENRLHQMTQYQLPTQYQTPPEFVTNNVDVRMRMLREQLAQLEQQQRMAQQGQMPQMAPTQPVISPQPLTPQQPTANQQSDQPAPPPINPNSRPSI